MCRLLGGGGKKYVDPPPKLLRGGSIAPPFPSPSSYAYVKATFLQNRYQNHTFAHVEKKKTFVINKII